MKFFPLLWILKEFRHYISLYPNDTIEYFLEMMLCLIRKNGCGFFHYTDKEGEQMINLLETRINYDKDYLEGIDPSIPYYLTDEQLVNFPDQVEDEYGNC